MYLARKKVFEVVDTVHYATALFVRPLDGLVDNCSVTTAAGIRVVAWLPWHRTLRSVVPSLLSRC